MEAKGIGEYSGTVSEIFTIGPKGTKLLRVYRRYKSYWLKWKKQPDETHGYELMYSRRRSFKNAKIKTIADTNIVRTRIKLPKAGRRYYIKVRTYKNVEGEKIYSRWSKVK